MIYFFILSFTLMFSRYGGVNDIYKKNQLRNEAEKAFNSKEYKNAIQTYSYLLDTLQTNDPAARLNLAHSYLLSKDSTNALQNYQKCLISENMALRSVALQQLGMIQYGMKNYKEALQSTKEALKANPLNEEARYNYELIKKTIKEQQEQDKKDQDKQDKQDKKDEKKQEQQKKDQEQQKKDEQDQKNEQKKEQQQQESKKEKEKSEKEKGEKDEKDEKEKEKEKQNEMKEEKDEKKEQQEKEQAMQPQQLKPISISPEMAKMILEAMKNSEKQFLQQLQKKPTKAKDKKGKDW